MTSATEGARAFELSRTPDGVTFVRSTRRLEAYPQTVCGDLVRWAARTPRALFLAERESAGWTTIDYGRAFARVRTIAAGLLASPASPGAPLAIVAANGIDHALVALAAMYVGIPIAPLSIGLAASAMAGARLRESLAILEPGLAFVDRSLEERVRAAAGAVPVTSDLAELAGDPASADAAFSIVDTETVAKIMFTSGSTGAPKGVITTNGMLSANQTQATMAWPELAAHRPVIVDWLPWSHTMGGSHVFDMVLRCGGTLYIDDGRPTLGAFSASVRNLSDVAPTMYFGVPRSFTLLLRELLADERFATVFFSRLRGLGNAAATLPSAVRKELIRLARRYAPQPVRVTSSWGMTETAPMATTSWGDCEADDDTIGTPVPGIELKLVPDDGRSEIRVKGPNVTPGYWRDPDATRAAFDEEHFLRTGDAGALKDPGDPSRGIVFMGRLAENFKLDTGTWVNVGALRLALVERGAPLIDDVVLTGHDREAVGALIFVRPVPTASPAEAPLAGHAALAALAHDQNVRRFIARVLAEHNAAAPATSTRIERALILPDSPDGARGEVTEKGSLNQRRVLELRAGAVAALHALEAGSEIILPRRDEDPIEGA